MVTQNKAIASNNATWHDLIMRLDEINFWLGLVITIVGGVITHLAGYRFYVWKLKSVFKKVNEIEDQLHQHEKLFLPKDDFRSALTDLRSDLGSIREQLHGLVLALMKR